MLSCFCSKVVAFFKNLEIRLLSNSELNLRINKLPAWDIETQQSDFKATWENFLVHLKKEYVRK